MLWRFSDFKNLTLSTLSWLAKVDCHITVVTGTAYPYQKELNDFLNENNMHISHKVGLSAQEMKEELLETDLAIVPASGILFEAVAVGCSYYFRLLYAKPV